MKRNAIIRIILWSLALVVLLTALGWGMSYSLPARNGWDIADATEVDATESPVEFPADSLNYGTSAGDIRSIQVDWVSGNIRIESADIDHIRISEAAAHKNTEAMLCRKEGDTLKISYRRGDLTSLKGIGTKDLTIQVPKGWACRKLEIDAATPKISVQGLTVDEVSLDTAGGESRFEDCTLAKMEVDTASGNLYFTGALDELEFDSASGGVEAELDNVPSEISMDTASGSMLLTLPKDAGFTASLDTMTGKFQSEFETTRSGDRYLCGDGACEIEMESMSGGLTVNRK